MTTWHDGSQPSDVPNVIRCPDCTALLLIDLLCEGFDADEVAERRRLHAPTCQGAA